MKPWMTRTESSAIAATRQCRSPSVAAAARAGTLSITTTVISTAFRDLGHLIPVNAISRNLRS
jgi:hypothetical protein